MMMVRLITRATCHREMRATCFPEGGVPTVRKEKQFIKKVNIVDLVMFVIAIRLVVLNGQKVK